MRADVLVLTLQRGVWWWVFDMPLDHPNADAISDAVAEGRFWYISRWQEPPPLWDEISGWHRGGHLS